MAIVLNDDSVEVVYRTKRTEKGIRCDVCERFIEADDDWASRERRKYFKVMTGHRDWGNDSCDSIEHLDICPNCIDKFVSDYLHDGSDTAYIEIETELTYPNVHWDD